MACLPVSQQPSTKIPVNSEKWPFQYSSSPHGQCPSDSEPLLCSCLLGRPEIKPSERILWLLSIYRLPLGTSAKGG